MSSRRANLQLERAVAHLMRARTELDEAAQALETLSESSGDRLALASGVAETHARLAEALAAVVHAGPHAGLDDLLCALTGEPGAARPRRH